ncbi:MAG: CoA transferase [Burkholderiales bacterium]
MDFSFTPGQESLRGHVQELLRAVCSPEYAEREMIVEYDHPEVGRVRLPGNPVKMSSMTGTPSQPAPRLGEHTDAVLGELLKLPAERIAALRREGAIG